MPEIGRFSKVIHAFFRSNTFISNASLKLAKNQANAKQHPEAEFLLFENYWFSSSTLSSRKNRKYSGKFAKSKCVCFNEITWLTTMKMSLKLKNRLQRYDLNRSRSRHGHNYIKYKMCLGIMMVIWVKQLPSNIWSSIHEKVKQRWGWFEEKRRL